MTEFVSLAVEDISKPVRLAERKLRRLTGWRISQTSLTASQVLRYSTTLGVWQNTSMTLAYAELPSGNGTWTVGGSLTIVASAVSLSAPFIVDTSGYSATQAGIRSATGSNLVIGIGASGVGAYVGLHGTGSDLRFAHITRYSDPADVLVQGKWQLLDGSAAASVVVSAGAGTSLMISRDVGVSGAVVVTGGAVRLRTQTSAAGAAPLYFTDSGNLLATVEEGAMEFANHALYFTQFQVRRSTNMAHGVVSAAISLANTTAETTLYSAAMASNYLRPSKMVELLLSGVYSTRNASDTVTFRLKQGGTTLLSFWTSGATVQDAAWHIDTKTTVRTTGTAGTAISAAEVDFNDTSTDRSQTTVTTLDTSVSNTFQLTAQWSVASTSNNVTVNQGYTKTVN